MYRDFKKDANFSFNRKEKKDHGEGGSIVGSPLKGKVVVIDDVITAGTAIRESVEIIKQNNAELAGVLIALDRLEKGINTDKSAIQQVQEDYQIKVVCIVTLADILEYLIEKGGMEQLVESIKDYRKQFGV